MHHLIACTMYIIKLFVIMSRNVKCGRFSKFYPDVVYFHRCAEVHYWILAKFNKSYERMFEQYINVNINVNILQTTILKNIEKFPPRFVCTSFLVLGLNFCRLISANRLLSRYICFGEVIMWHANLKFKVSHCLQWYKIFFFPNYHYTLFAHCK